MYKRDNQNQKFYFLIYYFLIIQSLLYYLVPIASPGPKCAFNSVSMSDSTRELTPCLSLGANALHFPPTERKIQRSRNVLMHLWAPITLGLMWPVLVHTQLLVLLPLRRMAMPRRYISLMVRALNVHTIPTCYRIP